MTQDSLDRDRLLALFSDWCNDELKEAERQELAAALSSDRRVRQLYLEYMSLHSELAWSTSTPADEELPVCPLPQPRQQGIFAALTRLRHRLQDQITSHVGLSLAMAGVVLLATVVALYFVPMPRISPTAADGRLAMREAGAAVISNTADCRWENANVPLGVGSVLVKGQILQLLEGVVEIQFESGADVIVVGPSEFLVDTPTAGTLRHGRLSARVSQPAQGFTISTPQAVVTDLGTEFGVFVGDDGQEEVHVFSGLVEVSFPPNDRAAKKLRTHEGLRLSPGTSADAAITSIEAEPQRFVRKIDPRGDRALGPGVAASNQPPTTRGLTLWLAGDGPLRLDSLGRVSQWGDQLAGENTKAQNAWQQQPTLRPLWVKDAVAGKPGLRFNGKNYLHLATATDLGIFGRPYEMFIVAQSNSNACQFLIAGGVEEFELHLNFETGARFIPAGYAYGALSSDIGKVGQFCDAKPHVFAARVSPQLEHCGVVQVDGQDSTDITTADVRSYNTAPLRLGQRQNGFMGMEGDIAEVLIYRGSLSASERLNVVDWLTKKYSIRPGS